MAQHLSQTAVCELLARLHQLWPLKLLCCQFSPAHAAPSQFLVISVFSEEPAVCPERRWTLVTAVPGGPPPGYHAPLLTSLCLSLWAPGELTQLNGHPGVPLPWHGRSPSLLLMVKPSLRRALQRRAGATSGFAYKSKYLPAEQPGWVLQAVTLDGVCRMRSWGQQEGEERVFGMSR